MPQPRLLIPWPSAYRPSNKHIRKTGFSSPNYNFVVSYVGFASSTVTEQRHGPAVDPNSLLDDGPATSPPTPSKDDKEAVLLKSKPPEEAKVEGTKNPDDTVQQPSQDLSQSNATPTPTRHYFDTYTLVTRLQDGGFTKPQSIMTMELIRKLLSEHLSKAKENLVSRSHFENDSYLFKAACSELRAEIQTLRQTQLEKMRSERQAVQTEFDLLNQKFMEEVMALKNELNGMFNDRKMINRAEQRAMENKIQELNYKITVMINSDLKSDIERLRWVTTRRALIAIGFLASFSVSMIKFAGHSKEKKKQNTEPIPESDAGGVGIGHPKHAPLTTEGLFHGGSV